VTVLATRVVEPVWRSEPLDLTRVRTAGPAVADFVSKVWHAPDPEQELILDDLFAVDDRGRPARSEVTVVAPRQQLKTDTIHMAELGWLFVLGLPLVLHTAHRDQAVSRSFRALRSIIEGHPALSSRLPSTRGRGLSSGNNDLSIELRDGQRIEYATRTGDTGRSATASRIVGDEWFAATAEHAGAILPTTLAVAGSQVLLASSAGKKSSDLLRQARDRGRGRLDPRQGYFEWGDPDAWQGCRSGDLCEHEVGAEGCALDDEARYARVLPSLGKRTSLEAVRDLRQQLTPLEFAREVLGWWDDPKSSSTLALPGWFDRLIRPDADGYLPEPPTDGIVLGVAVSVGQEFASIGAGARWADGRIHLGAVDRRRGTRWTIGELKRMQDELQAPVVIDEKCPDAELPDKLDVAGVETVTRNLDEVLGSVSWLITAVQEREVTHFGHSELDIAVRGAVPRRVGDRVAWGRRQSVADVSMLEAVTLAGQGVDEGLTLGAFNIY
jgi:hypothetical protein